jgi:hypothetical protein
MLSFAILRLRTEISPQLKCSPELPSIQSWRLANCFYNRKLRLANVGALFQGQLWKFWVGCLIQRHVIAFLIYNHERDIEGTATGNFEGHTGQRNFAMYMAEPHIEVLELVSLYFGN